MTSNNDIKQFGHKLRNLRTAKGWSQFDLAVESGIDSSYISRIERGITEPGLTKITALARALGCKIDELIIL